MTSKQPKSSVQPNVALCYIRQSYTRDANDTNSPERQRANIQAMCEKHGWTPEWYVDAEGHRSGRSEKNRPGWLALKTRLPDPDVVALVANDLARLHRKLWHVGRTLEMLDEYDVRLVLAAPGRDLDTSTQMGRMMVSFLAMQDEAYANDVAQRSKDSISYRKSKNVTVGIPPFGTVRDEKGFHVPSPYGAWLLPDGTFVAGENRDNPPMQEAIWRGYYECAKRILELYAQDKGGYNRIAKTLTKEGWAFRDRYNLPRLISSDDVRRVTSNWREYAGIISEGRAKERIANEIENPVGILYSTGREVFDIELLRAVATVQERRSVTTRPTGSVDRVYDYALLRLVYCSHCELIAEEQNNPRRRSRLSGTNMDKPRYRHAEGVHCGCKRRSVAAELLEGDFIRLVDLLMVKPDALPYMVELAIQSENGAVDEANFGEEKQKAIAKLRRKIDAARHLFEEGDLSLEEYRKRKEENERQISYWEGRTTEAQKKSIELAACLDAINRIVELWPNVSGEDKLMLARGLFDYLVYDLDKQQIVDFRLHPWADHYLMLRSDLYGDPSGGEDENRDADEENKNASSVSSDEAFHDPNGTRTLTTTITRDYRVAAELWWPSSHFRAA